MKTVSWKKTFLAALILTLSCLHSFSGSLLLKDGAFYRGTIAYLSGEKLILNSDGRYLSIQCKDIELLCCSDDDERRMTLNLNSLGAIEAEIIKIAGDYIYYLTVVSKSYGYTHLRNISSPYILNSEVKMRDVTEVTVSDKRVELELDILDFIEFITPGSLGPNSKNRLEMKIMDYDFYEKFWLLFSPLLSDETNGVIWELLEGYSEKERLSSKKYRGAQYRKGTERERYLEEIKSLREEFYCRVKRAVLLME